MYAILAQAATQLSIVLGSNKSRAEVINRGSNHVFPATHDLLFRDHFVLVSEK
jgi:hypothetical protein